jgi:3-oxoacyl-[acyl-carrier-protein] synthase II
VSRRVVITGVGLVTPIGIGAETVWNALIGKRCGVRRIDAFDPSRFDCQVAGQIESLTMGDFVPKSYRKRLTLMARDIEIAVACAHEAAKDAGLRTKCLIERGEAEGPSNVDSTRFGANIGAGLICADLTELAGALFTAADATNRRFDIRKWGAEGMNNLTPLWLLKFLPNMLACHVTIVHDCQAPSNTITCGEASSHLAIGEAFRIIARGSADAWICGGAESKFNPMGLIRQSLLRRLATDRNDDPAGACRPFDADRTGTVISEGGGLLILEELEHAQKRGARIYAEVVGFGAGASSRSWRQLDPDGASIAVAIRKALADAGIKPEEVNLISAFGCGTPEHDRAEARAIHHVFGARAAEIPVLATKGAMGNNGAGSGAIDLGAAVLCMKNDAIAASQNTDRVDPKCNLNVVRGETMQMRIETVLSTAYALGGGQTAALVLRRFT